MKRWNLLSATRLSRACVLALVGACLVLSGCHHDHDHDHDWDHHDDHWDHHDDHHEDHY